MTEVVSLELFKKHVRADDFTDDDTYLQHLLDAAQESIIFSTNRTEAELIEIGGGVFPATLQQAVMLLAAHWYNQRESASTVQMTEVPGTLQVLTKPYRKLVSDTSV